MNRPASRLSFFAELQRRHVYKVGAMYAVAGWLLVQVITQVFPIYDISTRVQRIFVGVIIAGFPIAIVLAWLFDLTPQGIVRTAGTPAAGETVVVVQARRNVDRRLNYVLGTLLVAAVGYVAAERIGWVVTAKSGGTEVADRSIAVLPLVNSTGDASQEYFSDGVSEELISSLSRLQKLKVISRTSSFKFKGKTDDSKAIGVALGVAYLLEGSVRKANDRVRVNVDLVNAEDGRNVWSDTYDRELKDIFAVQSEIAGAVAGQLKVALLGDNAETIKQATASVPSNQNVEAYNALLQGNFYSNRGTVADFTKAVEQYRRAIQIDPGYALAYAKLSDTLTSLLSQGSFEGRQRQAMAEEARRTVDTALQLDPGLSAAYYALGSFHSYVDLDLAAADSAYHRAAELAPNDAEILGSLGNLKANAGESGEAVVLLQRAMALDPLLRATYNNLGFELTVLGRYDEAEACLRKGLALQPQAQAVYSKLAILQILRGNPAEAVALAQQEPEGPFKTYALALAQFANGDQVAADAALQKLIHEDADDGGSQIASIYALRKDPDQAFHWLQHAVDTQDSGVIVVREDPFLLAYKDDPRYIAIARKVGVMTEAEATKAGAASPSRP